MKAIDNGSAAGGRDWIQSTCDQLDVAIRWIYGSESKIQKARQRAYDAGED